MIPTTHIGYGPFHLGDFLPGEGFARYDGSLAQVCDPQPKNHPEHIQVWLHPRTSQATRTWLHHTTLAYALSEEQAWAIERRRRQEDSP